MDIDPMALWLARDCLIREARYQYSVCRRNAIALQLLEAARQFGPMDPKHETQARQLERWARPTPLDKAA